MKKLNRLFLYSSLFILHSSLVFAQQATFNWNDTVFTKGAEKRVWVEWGVDSGELLESSRDTLMSVVKFMKNNPTIKIEVGAHTDPRGSFKHNFILSHARAQSVTNFLITRGIDSVRIAVKGYGGTKPLQGCSDADIAKMKTREEKETAWQADRRMMIKIIAPDSGNIFNWGDDRFMKYSRRVLRLQFNLDSSSLRGDPATMASIDSVVNFLKSHTYLHVGIYVHTDPLGSIAHNMKLSKGRVETIAYVLKTKGIDTSRIVAKSWGSTRPIIPVKKIAQMKTELEKQVAWQTDRRVELVILGTMKSN